MKVSAGLYPSQGPTGVGSASKFTWLVGRILFYAGCWLEAALSSLPSGPLQNTLAKEIIERI